MPLDSFRDPNQEGRVWSQGHDGYYYALPESWTNPYPTAPAGQQEADSGGVELADYFKGVMSGSAGLVAGAGWLTKKLPLMEAFGGAIENLGNDAVDYWNDSMSESAKAELGKQFVQKNEAGEYEWGDPSLQTVLLTGVQSLPSMAGGMGVGAGLAKVLQTFANPLARGALGQAIKAGEKAVAGSPEAIRAVQAAKKLAMVNSVLSATGFGAGEALVAVPDAAASVEHQVSQLSIDKLMQSERWREVYDSAEDMAEPERIKYATDTIAKEAGSQAGWRSGLTTFLLGGGAGAYYGKLLNKGPAAKLAATFKALEEGGLGKRVATGAAVEAGQEFLQSGAQQYQQNRAVIDWADPTLDPWESVLNQAVGGAAVGGPLGGGFAALVGKPDAPAAEKPSEFDAILQRAQETTGARETPLLTGPEGSIQRPAPDYEVGAEGITRKPGEQIARLALPAPDGAGVTAEPNDERVRREHQDEIDRAVKAAQAVPDTDEPMTDILMIDASGKPVKRQSAAERDAADRLARERASLGQQQTGTNPGRDVSLKIRGVVGAQEDATHPKGAGSKAVPMRWAVVEASDVKVSNDHLTGRPSKYYPQELQPRERLPVDIIAANANPEDRFDADAMLQGGSTATGSPIIGPDGNVESGNGRMLTFKAMAEQPGAMQEYQQKLIARAKELGIPLQQLQGFKNPVLVRVRAEPMDAAERKQFAIDANAEPGGTEVDRLEAMAKPVPRSTNAPADSQADSIIEFMARHDIGISLDEADAQGLDRAQLNSQEARVGVRRAFRKGGMSFDAAAELLSQHGYPVVDENGDYNPNDLLNALDRELRGQKVYSANNSQSMQREAAQKQLLKLRAERQEKKEIAAYEARLEPGESQANATAAESGNSLETLQERMDLLSQWEREAEEENEASIDAIARRETLGEDHQGESGQTSADRAPEGNSAPESAGAGENGRTDEEIVYESEPDAELDAEPTLANNASGQTEVSLEAISALKQQRPRYRVDTETGEKTPLPGIEARDPRARAGEVIVEENPDSQNGFDIVDRGGTPQSQLAGVIARMNDRARKPTADLFGDDTSGEQALADEKPAMKKAEFELRRRVTVLERVLGCVNG